MFLDELGEMDLAIQVKLLRVMETRRFSAVGDTVAREFHGKLIAATNRDLPAEIRAGRFREDLYYRLCADLIQTPSLADQIRDSPQVLHELVHYMTLRTVGDEAERCLPEVEEWIAQHLPADYAWPGNYRELEQCVRNVIIRRSYQPLAQAVRRAMKIQFFARFRAGTLTADELLAHYAARVYRLTGSYEEAARRMGLDRRTVKAKVERYLEAGTRLEFVGFRFEQEGQQHAAVDGLLAFARRTEPGLAGGAKGFRYQQACAFALGGSDARAGYLAFRIDRYHHIHSHFRLDLRFQIGSGMSSGICGPTNGSEDRVDTVLTTGSATGISDLPAAGIAGRAGAAGGLGFTIGSVSTDANRIH